MRACVGPPSRGLASSCPTCVPVVYGCLSLPLHRWCIRFPEVLPPLVSQCLPTCEFVLDACLSWSPQRCACVGWCVRLPEVCLPSLRLCSIVSHMCACVRCCVRLPEVLSPIASHCLPTYVCLCWMVCPLVSPCFPLFPHIVAHVSLRWKVCSPSQGLVSPLSPHILGRPVFASPIFLIF